MGKTANLKVVEGRFAPTPGVEKRLAPRQKASQE